MLLCTPAGDLVCPRRFLGWEWGRPVPLQPAPLQPAPYSSSLTAMELGGCCCWCLVTLRGTWLCHPWVGAAGCAALGLPKATLLQVCHRGSLSSPRWKRAAGFWLAAHCLYLPRSELWSVLQKEFSFGAFCSASLQVGFFACLC